MHGSKLSKRAHRAHSGGGAPRFTRIMLTVRKKLAPMRSILLTKQMRGTPYLSACSAQTPQQPTQAAAAHSAVPLDRGLSEAAPPHVDALPPHVPDN